MPVKDGSFVMLGCQLRSCHSRMISVAHVSKPMGRGASSFSRAKSFRTCSPGRIVQLRGRPHQRIPFRSRSIACGFQPGDLALCFVSERPTEAPRLQTYSVGSPRHVQIGFVETHIREYIANLRLCIAKAFRGLRKHPRGHPGGSS